jgi:hypothetical protein
MGWPQGKKSAVTITFALRQAGLVVRRATAERRITVAYFFGTLLPG